MFCGKRGKGNSKLPGNLKFSNVIRSSIPGYVDAETRSDKAIYVASVVSFLQHDIGLQFMCYDKTADSYTELNVERVHDKVSHAIRDQMKQNAKDQRQGASTSCKRRKRKNSLICNSETTKTNGTMTPPTTMSLAGNFKALPSSVSESSLGTSAPSSSHKEQNTIQQTENAVDISKMGCPSSFSCIKSIPGASGRESFSPSVRHIPSFFLNDMVFDLGDRIEDTFSLFDDIPAFPDASTSTSNREMIPLRPLSSSSAKIPDSTVGTMHLPLPVDATTDLESQDMEEVLQALLTGIA